MFNEQGNNGFGSSFGNNGGYNGSKSISVSTKLYTSYSPECLLTMTAWNSNQLGLKLAPATGVDQNGITKYAYDNSQIIQTALNIDNVTALLDGINKELLTEDNKDKEASVSVTVSSGLNKKIVTVGRDADKHMYLAVTVGVSEDNKALDGNTLKHTFQPKSYITGYNPADGSGNVVEVQSDFTNFVKKLNDVYNLAPTTVHQEKYMSACNKLFGNKDYQKNSFNSYNNQNNQSFGSSQTSGEVANIDSLADFMADN